MTRSTEVEISSPGGARPRFALLLFLSKKSGSAKIPLQEIAHARESTRNAHLRHKRYIYVQTTPCQVSWRGILILGRVSWREILRNGDTAVDHRTSPLADNIRSGMLSDLTLTPLSFGRTRRISTDSYVAFSCATR